MLENILHFKFKYTITPNIYVNKILTFFQSFVSEFRNICSPGPFSYFIKFSVADIQSFELRDVTSSLNKSLGSLQVTRTVQGRRTNCVGMIYTVGYRQNW